MALLFNTQGLFDAAGAVFTRGVREDLSEIIYQISPTETPFLMLAGRGEATAVIHEWQTDRLSAPDPANAALEGDTAGAGAAGVPSSLAAVPTIRLRDWCQISQKTISVTGTVEVTTKAGRKSELAYQLAKRAKELKRDLEAICVGQTTVASMASLPRESDVASRIGAVQSWFHANEVVGGTALPYDNTLRGTGGADGGYSTATNLTVAPTEGSPQRALLESDLKGAIQAAWGNGGDPTVIMVGPFNKAVISGFTGNSTRYDEGSDKRLVAAIDVYVSDYGEHRVIPNRFQRERDCFVLTPELWSVDYLRPFRQHALAKTGDSEQRQLLAEWTLRSNNAAGSAIVADLTTS